MFLYVLCAAFAMNCILILYIILYVATIRYSSKQDGAPHSTRQTWNCYLALLCYSSPTRYVVVEVVVVVAVVVVYRGLYSIKYTVMKYVYLSILLIILYIYIYTVFNIYFINNIIYIYILYLIMCSVSKCK